MRFIVALATVAVIGLSPARAQQDPGDQTLEVVAKDKGGHVELSGTVKLPDEAILTIVVGLETETLVHHKIECRIVPVFMGGIATVSAKVKGKQFNTRLDVNSGFYRYTVQYMRFAQRDARVENELGPTYVDWERSYNLCLVNPDTLVGQLKSEHPKVVEFTDRLKGLLRQVESFLSTGGDMRAWEPIRRDVQAQREKVRKFSDGSLYTCSVQIVADTLNELDNCSPGTPLQGYAPDSADAQHIMQGGGDIPANVNMQWNLERVHVYIRRALRALDRERVILPLRYARTTWDDYVAVIRMEQADEKSLDAAEKVWQAARDAAKRNAEAIESEFPDEEKRDGRQKEIAEWCAKSVEVLDKLDDFVVQRRAVRQGSAEERTELDVNVFKECQQAFDGLNSTLRRFQGT